MNDTHSAAPQVAILLMTYNGEQYLPQLLASLRGQTYTRWRLYVQDDLSTDATPRLLAEAAAADPRIEVLPRGAKYGAKGGFMHLLQHTEADYYLFCDQDDVWLPEKVEVTLRRMHRAEAEWGKQAPLVVHTDLTVVDSELREISPSFWRYSRIAPQLLRTFDEQAGHNLCTGCTMLLNAAARRVSLPCPPEALMHDAWVALSVLRSGGHVCEVDKSTILYRQHGSNTLGAHDIQTGYLCKRLSRLRSVWRENRAHYAMLRAAGYGSAARYLYHKVAYFLRYRKLPTAKP